MTDLSHAFLRSLADEEDLTTRRDLYTNEIVFSGWLHKLGYKVLNWKKRFVVVRGDGKMLYYSVAPTPARPLRTLSPKGEINLKRDCVELMHFHACKEYLRRRPDDRVNHAKWHATASQENSFAIRTTHRTYLFCSPSNNVVRWFQSVEKVCEDSGVYLGVDASLRGLDGAASNSAPSTPAPSLDELQSSASNPTTRKASVSDSVDSDDSDTFPASVPPSIMEATDPL